MYVKSMILVWMMAACNHVLGQPITAIPERTKLLSQRIATLAAAGTPQELIVEFDVGTLMDDVFSQRLKLRDEIDPPAARANQTKADKESTSSTLTRQDDLLLNDYKLKLRAIKQLVFAHFQPAGARVVEDYDSSPSALVYVPDENALKSIEADARVKTIGENRPTKASAN